MKLTTKRLILRQITERDIESLIANISNLNVSRYLLAVAYPYTKKDAEWWINHCKEKAAENPRVNYELNIQLKGQQGIIGGVGISHINKGKGTCEIGYWLAEDYWRKGIMTEAAREIINFAFQKLQLKRINAPIFAENKVSQRFAKSLGFKYKRTKKKKFKAKSTGKLHLEKVHELSREDWERG
jgi:RimJ/RimL family protein N-acetyltransferase